MENITVENEFENKEAVRKYPLPPITTRFPSKLNELQRNERNKEWFQWIFNVSTMSLKQFVKMQGTGIGFAYSFPFVTDINRYETLVKYSALYFVIDDISSLELKDSNTSDSMLVFNQVEKSMEKLEGKHIASNFKWRPYIEALNEKNELILQDFNDVQRKRFIREHRLFAEGLKEEFHFVTQKKNFKDLDHYKTIRLKNVGMRPYIQMIEYASGLFIPDSIWNDLLWQQWMDSLALFVIYVNDIHSFEKEMNENERFNSVLVIREWAKISIEEAVLRVAHLLKVTEEKVYNIQKQMKKDYLGHKDPEVIKKINKFIDCANYMMGGIFKVHNHLDRYKKHNIDYQI